LVSKAQKGDEAAYLQLFQQHEAVIYRTAFVYLKNREDALDVVQETAYRSFKSLHTLKEPQFFKTWLTKIAINCAVALLRQRHKVLPPQFPDSTPDHADTIPLSVSLCDLLNRLSDTEKGTVVVRFYHGYTIKESAEILEMPLGTAKTVLYRALGKLRHSLREEHAR
jgi:RNA polymerase sigma-70 factor (ECF subfamily)